jgi:hypothetical protein
MADSTATRRAILFLSLALLGGGAWVGYREASPYFRSGIEDSERFAALAQAPPTPGLSIASERLVLDGCVRAISSVYGRLQSAVRKAEVNRNCLRAADTAAQANRSSSYAWYVGALTSAQLGDITGMNERLLRSQQTGPAEQWIAELRVPLAEDHFNDLSPEARVNHDRDLRMLVASARGISSIAARYVNEAAFRERITAIVETMPEADQRRFVSRVDSASGPAVGG